MASAAVSDEGALRMRPTPCGCTSARWEPTNSPQIPMKTVRTARADVGIGPYKRIQNHVRVDDSARLFHNEFALPAHA